MKRLSILGATGSIGRSTLDVVARFPESFDVVALAGATQVDLLARQIQEFRPEVAVVLNAEKADQLAALLPPDSAVEILWGKAGYCQAAAHSTADTVVSAIVGGAGLMPTLAAIKAKKDVALANKETLVMAGPLVMAAAQAAGVRILPVDSEHSAIFQCLTGGQVDQLILTASGGPFRTWEKSKFPEITRADALNHPTWVMGDKITIDSATLMNKGLEVIEARYLFDVAPEQIKVVVHPQSIVHSMVAYQDGSVLAQMGMPDMRGAIAYALSFPERLPLKLPVPDWAALSALTFEAPDLDRFPCLALAFSACRAGGTLPAVMNAANEAAVADFLTDRIRFIDIPDRICRAMDAHDMTADPDLETILAADAWARAFVSGLPQSG
ncbi:MAG: 1-deoxy-D-xylulose-5-phosphate reductoisomerase [Deltaproteobacteria bacterium]|nr:MAG: 1-deoxy-D-xylulose-5-phosphate reductoisomerase [Deltaproteobacteria bacterium]